MVRATGSKHLEKALREQDRAVLEFEDLVTACPEHLWRRTRAAGKWDLATLATHLLLTLEKSQESLELEPLRDGRLGLGFFRRWFLWGVSRYVLRFRFIPRRGIRSPPEFVPKTVHSRREILEALERVRRRAASVYRKLEESTALPALVHPVLGVLRTVEWPRFQAIHFEHHSRQFRTVLRSEGVRLPPVSLRRGEQAPNEG